METHHDGGWWDLIVVQEMAPESDDMLKSMPHIKDNLS